MRARGELRYVASSLHRGARTCAG